MRIRFTLVCLLALLVRSTEAQATRVVADSGSYLLRVTQDWGRQSRLGALVERRAAVDDIEVRLWQGYGLAGTWGTVIRRERGRWAGWHVEVVRCSYSVPIPVGDTLTPRSFARYKRLAKERCGERNAGEADAPPGTYGWSVILADTVGMVRLQSTTSLSAVWTDLVRAGVTELPTRVPRSWIMLDGHSYVVELRNGNSYRASVIEHTSPPATSADSVVQAVAAIFNRLCDATDSRATLRVRRLHTSRC